jgi:hypothetical protein
MKRLYLGNQNTAESVKSGAEFELGSCCNPALPDGGIEDGGFPMLEASHSNAKPSSQQLAVSESRSFALAT